MTWFIVYLSKLLFRSFYQQPIKLESNSSLLVVGVPTADHMGGVGGLDNRSADILCFRINRSQYILIYSDKFWDILTYSDILWNTLLPQTSPIIYVSLFALGVFKYGMARIHVPPYSFYRLFSNNSCVCQLRSPKNTTNIKHNGM